MSTPSRDELVKLRFEQEKTREDIAEHYDVSIATVRRWIKDMDIPRPRRQLNRRRLRGISASGEIIAEIDPGYTRLEQAQMKLGGRLAEKPGYGYYLDGRPVNVDMILAVAQV